MFDHISIVVADFATSKAFYEAALAPLGYHVVMEPFPGIAGFGDERPQFWIGEGGPDFWASEHEAGRAPIHVAFTSPDRATVDAFYEAAMAAGGVDHGAPGVRAIYHPNYYGAFVLDPDGNNIEAVCHVPEG